MPFVTRDAAGRIVALHRDRSEEAPEFLSSGHPEIVEFAGTEAASGAASGAASADRPNMLHSDLEMIRVYEDLIDILISKRIVVLTDFPTAAQEKLVRRKRLRSSLSALTDVLSPESDDGEEEALP